jgi:hypothetical protein
VNRCQLDYFLALPVPIRKGEQADQVKFLPVIPSQIAPVVCIIREIFAQLYQVSVYRYPSPIKQPVFGLHT